MSFKHKFISATATALAVAAFGTFVSAQDAATQPSDSTQQQEMREGRGKRGFGGKRGGKRGGDKMMRRALGQLNLSDAQKEQMRTISEDFRTSTQTERDEMRQLRMKKRDGIITDTEEARLKTLRMQLKTSGEQLRNSMLAILTAEQRAQLEQIKVERKQKMMERRRNRQNQTAPTTEVN